MEVLIGFMIIMLLLVALDVVAIKWGPNVRRHTTRTSYDPRSEWHSQS